ncbi:OmpA family protein [Simiduia sp. 21SJ11W-1]|uniref:OmpA family protein n=1 Tax=Simiduia sp. 21SJ11W-1 TaxID=2909669 RepID=UPI00209CD7A5|nr:OmpA family protein [Simiduia sp. 21SJ11W-1]UTA46679.1 OmpA family protein [Simiduia sp. 21SJ11W-1]
MRKFVVVIAALALAACQTMDPYTGEQKTSNATTGAAVGAVAGAVLGAATAKKGKDRGKAAARGAAIGGIAGMGVGYYMDQQEMELRQELEGTGVRVRRDGDKLYLIMPGNITFATGRFEIRGDFYPTLNSVAKVLKKFDETAIKVAGHTDSVGSDSSNQVLSERRAESVAQYLRGQQIAAARVQAIGFGERYPVADNNTAAGREQNRRVELELIPMN